MSKHFIDLHPDSEEWGHYFLQTECDERIHYVQQGHGKTVILLHGWPGFWYDWRRVLPILSKDANVICPDFLGFGGSDKPNKRPEEAYTPEVQAERIVTLINKLDLDEIIIAGYDIGARIAQTIIQIMKERIAGLVLCNPPYPGIGERRFDATAQQQFWYQHFHNIPNAGKIIGHSRETTKLYLEHYYNHWVRKKDALRPKEFEAIVDVYSRDNGMERSIAWYQAGAGTGLRGNPMEEKVKIIDTPTIVLWSEKDPIFPSNWADQLHLYFRSHTLVRLKDVGHFIPFEAPEAIIKAIFQLREEN